MARVKVPARRLSANLTFGSGTGASDLLSLHLFRAFGNFVVNHFDLQSEKEIVGVFLGVRLLFKSSRFFVQVPVLGCMGLPL
jgi:hypothetical protein